jgi:hypothetical protein
MTNKGADFLENWIATNVTSETRLSEVVTLAEGCIWEAAGVGIKPEEIEAEWGGVENAIHDAIVHLPETEVPVGFPEGFKTVPRQKDSKQSKLL